MVKIVAVLISGLWFAVTPRYGLGAEPLSDLVRTRIEGPEMLSVLSYVAYPKEKNGVIVPSKIERRTLSVVRERLGWNRLHTPEEIARTNSQFNEDGKILNLEHDTFQNPKGDVVFWVLDGPMDGKTEEAITLGVVYGFEWWPAEAQPPLRGWAADIVWHYSFPDQPLLVLSHNLASDLTIAVFPVDLDIRLEMKPLSLVNKKEVKYPKPLVPVTELRTDLLQGSGSIEQIRAIPQDNGALMVAALRTSGRKSILCRYNFDLRSWSESQVEDHGSLRKTHKDIWREMNGKQIPTHNLTTGKKTAVSAK
jgi:hypothetical protein